MDYHYPMKHDLSNAKYFNKEALDAFLNWDNMVMAPGRLDKKHKELIAVACTYLTRCPYCIQHHAKAALEAGATKEDLAEVIQIAGVVAAGASLAHLNFALDVEI